MLKIANNLEKDVRKEEMAGEMEKEEWLIILKAVEYAMGIMKNCKSKYIIPAE